MFNYIDLLVLLLISYFIWQGLKTGFIGGLLNVLATIIAFVLATVFYPSLASFLERVFHLNSNISLVTSFVAILLLLEVVLNILFTALYSKIAPLYKKSTLIANLDKYLGIIPSVGIGIFLITLFMLLTLVLPVKPWLRNPIADSWWGKNVVSQGINYVPAVEKVLARLPYKSLVFILTPPSANNEEVQTLNLPKNIALAADPAAEAEMLSLVNRERVSRGLRALRPAKNLRDVGRAHCEDMFKRGYFSHYTPEGKSPFDRMEEAHIEYIAAGENLAYAPSTPIAHQGLMNSPGHRENILRPEFGTLGVGVIDGGLNGKMFCQEFSN